MCLRCVTAEGLLFELVLDIKDLAHWFITQTAKNHTFKAADKSLSWSKMNSGFYITVILLLSFLVHMCYAG